MCQEHELHELRLMMLSIKGMTVIIKGMTVIRLLPWSLRNRNDIFKAWNGNLTPWLMEGRPVVRSCAEKNKLRNSAEKIVLAVFFACSSYLCMYNVLYYKCMCKWRGNESSSFFFFFVDEGGMNLTHVRLGSHFSQRTLSLILHGTVLSVGISDQAYLLTGKNWRWMWRMSVTFFHFLSTDSRAPCSRRWIIEVLKMLRRHFDSFHFCSRHLTHRTSSGQEGVFWYFQFSSCSSKPIDVIPCLIWSVFHDKMWSVFHDKMTINMPCGSEPRCFPNISEFTFLQSLFLRDI